MTIEEAVSGIDNLKRNTYTVEDKIGWLQRLDSQIFRQIVLTHAGKEEVMAPNYRDGAMNQELLAPEPFDQMYLHYLEAQIDYYNGEITLYNEAMTMFNAAYSDFENWYNRRHMPDQTARLRYF